MNGHADGLPLSRFSTGELVLYGNDPAKQLCIVLTSYGGRDGFTYDIILQNGGREYGVEEKKLSRANPK